MGKSSDGMKDEPFDQSDGKLDQTGEVAAMICSDIAHTRCQLSSTVDALQERLAPERVKQEIKQKVQHEAIEAYGTAKNAVKQAAVRKAEKIMDNVSDSTRKVGTAVGEAGSTVFTSIRKNPFPIALIGAGLGMLLIKSFRKRSEDRTSLNYWNEYDRSGTDMHNAPSVAERARDAVADIADRTQEKINAMTSTVREAADTVASQTREQVTYLSDRARTGARQAGSTLQQTLQGNPLAFGVAMIATGAIFGLALPSSDLERDYLGEKRDQLMDTAQSFAKETVEKVQHVAEAVGRTAKEEAVQQGLIVDDQSTHT